MVKRKGKKRRGMAFKKTVDDSTQEAVSQETDEDQIETEEEAQTSAEVSTKPQAAEPSDMKRDKPARKEYHSASQQMPFPDPEGEVSEKGGLIVVAVIFSLIGAAIIAQYFLH